MALTLALVQGGYILSRDISSVANRLFFMISLAMALWLFGAVFGYSSATAEEGLFWMKVASPGFIFLHAFVLHFVARLSGLRSRLIYLVYIPSFILLYWGVTSDLVFSEAVRHGDYWVLQANLGYRPFQILMTQYLIYYLIALVLLWRLMKNSKRNRVRKQSRILIAAIVVTIASYNIEPFLAPLISDYRTYGVAPIFSIIWLTLIWFSMDRYRFLGVREKDISEDLLNAMYEMVTVLDREFNVVLCNAALSRFRNNVQAESLEELFVEHELLERLLKANEEKGFSYISVNLKKHASGEAVMVEVRGFPFTDSFDDEVGYILFLHELALEKKRLAEMGITDREMQIIELIYSGNTNRQIAETLDIRLRTVETHVGNIFNKLGLSSRNELVNYCNAMMAAPS